MKPFDFHRGLVVPLARANVDTDMIIRMEHCAVVPRDKLGPFAFESLRVAADGTPVRSCVFNDARFADASILVALDNFGCGSSREMAVWALAGMGLRCVIAPRFGDIFFANCFQNGLLPIRLRSDVVDALIVQAAEGGLELEVDLAAQTIEGMKGGAIAFDVEPLRKRMLLEGLDEINLSIGYADVIDRWQRCDRSKRPWVYKPPVL